MVVQSDVIESRRAGRADCQYGTAYEQVHIRRGLDISPEVERARGALMLYSSTIPLTGNLKRANHIEANMSMETFGRFHCARSLPVPAMRLDTLADVGWGARNAGGSHTVDKQFHYEVSKPSMAKLSGSITDPPVACIHLGRRQS